MADPLFPKYKHHDTVAIVGFSPSSRDQAFTGPDLKDLWSLNEALSKPWFKGTPTAWFQMHPKWDFARAYNRNDPTHWDWLKQKHPFPIFMQSNFIEVPSSVRYPLEEAMDEFGTYFTSTPAYMIALAILMDYKRIEIYGIDASADSEYRYQKPCIEYLIGQAQGRGIEVHLPVHCPLLRGNLYGYEDLRAGDVTYFSQRKTMLQKHLDEREMDLNVMVGRIEELKDMLKSQEFTPEDVARIGARLEQRMADHEAVYLLYGRVRGAVEELTDAIRWHDSQNIPADRDGWQGRTEKDETHEPQTA